MLKKILHTILICLAAIILSTGTAMAADALPTLVVGHVGHDHQIALYVAADAGRSIEARYGAWLKVLKEFEVYELYDHGRAVALIKLVRVGGGAKMPAALEQGHIEVGLGGLGPVAKFVDKGAAMRVLAPLNNDGDALVVSPDLNASDWASFVRLVKASKKPLRIGYKSPMAVAYMIFTRALDEEGITYGPETLDSSGKPVGVILVNLQGLDNALPSLAGDIVDGVVVNEPASSMLAVKGEGRIIADLSHLPPSGKWEGHPCCVVAARDEAIASKREIIKSFLKVIKAGSDIIAADFEAALSSEHRWTGTSTEIGRRSIPNVTYVASPDAAWLTGVDTWISLMQGSGHFKKNLQGLYPESIRARLLDLGLMEEALRDMPAR